MTDLLYSQVIEIDTAGGEGQTSPPAVSKHPLLICHGLLGSGENWRGIARLLARHFPIHLLDLCNHGRSFHRDKCSMRDAAEDILRYADHVGLARFHLLGHSLGGKFVMSVAGMQPERVVSMCVVDVAPKSHSKKQHYVLDALQNLDLAAVQSRGDADRALADAIPDSMVRLFCLKNLTRDDTGFRWRVHLPALLANYPSWVGAPELDRSYQGPTLFIRGALSKYIQDEDLSLIQRLYERAEVKTVADAGHWVHAEQTDTFLQLVQAFYQDVISE